MNDKLRLYLATSASDAKAAEGLSFPCAYLLYIIAENGMLQRAQVSLATRGGLLGIYRAEGLANADLERLARDIYGECGRRGLSGVVLDFEPAPEHVEIIRELSRKIMAKKLTVFCSPALYEYGCKVIIPSAVSGGSFSDLLSSCVSRFGAQNVCLEVVRSCNDFTMPSYSPEGVALSPSEFRAITEKHRPGAYFSPDLCAKYFTYRNDGEAHFVIFDDLDTAAHKLDIARKQGIFGAFLLYSDWGTAVRELFMP